MRLSGGLTRCKGLFLLFVCLGFLMCVFIFSSGLPKVRKSSGSKLSSVERYLTSLDHISGVKQESLKVNDTLARKLKSRVRLLCLIFTRDANLNVNGQAVKNTWAKRCSKYLFIMETRLRRPNIINVVWGDTRESFTQTLLFTFQQVYDTLMKDFDWLVTADDQTYIIVENLRFLLSYYNSTRPGYLQFILSGHIGSDVRSGKSSGFVISNRGLRRLIEFGVLSSACSSVLSDTDRSDTDRTSGMERCFNKSNVPRLSSLDLHGKETFHPYPIESYLGGHMSAFSYQSSLDVSTRDHRCCSLYTFSFRSVRADVMLAMDHLLYKTSVYGINDPDLNPNLFRINTFPSDNP